MDKKKRKRLFRVLFVLAAILFLLAAGTLLYYWWEYYQADEEYRQVTERVVRLRDESELTGGEGGGNATASGILEDEDPPKLLIDFDELSSINEDVVAWIDFPGQDISYPVVQCGDNDKYLNYSVAGSQSNSGAIFVDYRNDGLMKDGNTIIYGHNMRNGSMFGSLRNYQKPEHYEQFPYFDVYTPEGAYRCTIISATRVRPDGDSYRVVFTSDENRADYISLVKQLEYYEMPDAETDVTVEPAPYVRVLGEEGSGEGSAPPLVLLSTCTGGNHDYRFVLLAQVRKFYRFY